MKNMRKRSAKLLLAILIAGSIQNVYGDDFNSGNTGSPTTNQGEEITDSPTTNQGEEIKEDIKQAVATLIVSCIHFGLSTYIQHLIQRKVSEKVLRQSELISTRPKETFKDVAGADEAKDACQDVLAFFKNPKKFTKNGAKPPKGILLEGPPGNGKTLLAKALAGEAKCNFIYKSGTDLTSQVWAGSGAASVRNLFALARKKAPCIIFIDEIDAVGGKRFGSGSLISGDNAASLNQLLTELDGFNSTADKPVILLAATNLADTLDPALVRPGRIDRRIKISNPGQKDREEILGVHAKKVSLDSNVDLATIARCTAGFSGADLANLIEQAALTASKAEREKISMLDIQEAWQTKILGGKENKTMELTQEDLERTAYHEAGHALIALLTPEHSDPLYMVTIKPRGGTLGVTTSVPEREKQSQSQKELQTIITKCMGGRAAEQLQFNQLYTGATSDIAQATNIARTMIQNFGLSKLGPIHYGDPHTPSPAFQEKIDAEIRDTLTSCYDNAYALLEQNKDKLDKLAAELLAKKTLQAAEIYELLGIEPRTCNQLVAHEIEPTAEAVNPEPEEKPGLWGYIRRLVPGTQG